MFLSMGCEARVWQTGAWQKAKYTPQIILMPRGLFYLQFPYICLRSKDNLSLWTIGSKQ